MDVISKKDAKAKGLKRYFTGEPCKHGHIAERYMSGSCMECKDSQSTKWRIDHPEDIKRIQDKCNKGRRDSQREYRHRPDVAQKIHETNKAWQSKNREKCRAYTKKWCEANPDKCAEYRSRPEVKARMSAITRKWAKDNPERRALWGKNNPEKRRAISGRRYAKKKMAMVPWADSQKIAAIYAEAERLTRETGIPHEVDHIIPIGGKTVMGLHHQDNLRVVTRTENRSKGNKMPEAA